MKSFTLHGVLALALGLVVFPIPARTTDYVSPRLQDPRFHGDLRLLSCGVGYFKSGESRVPTCLPNIPDADISGFAPSVMIDTTNAANISSSTLAPLRLSAPTFSTLGGMKSLSPVAHYFIIRIGAEAAPQTARPNASASVFSPVGTNAVASTVNAQLDDRISVSQFATPQDAINAAAVVGRRVFWPCGTYTIASTLVVTASFVDLEGESAGCVVIQTSSATDDIIQIGDNQSWIKHVRLRNITLWSTVTKTAGAAVNARMTMYTTLDHVNAGRQDLYAAHGARLYNGIIFNKFVNDTLTASRVMGASYDCLQIYGDSHQQSAEFSSDASDLIAYCGHDGIVVGGGVGGVHLNFGELLADRYGLYVTTTLGGANNREIMLGETFSSDTNRSDGIHVDAGSVYMLSCDQCWSAGSSGGSGFVVTGAQYPGAIFRFQGSYFQSNRTHGAYFGTGFDGHLFWNGGTASLNGNVAAAHGIWIQNPAAAATIAINGVRVTNNGTGGTGFGILINDAASLSNEALIGNDVTGNSGGSIQNEITNCDANHVVWGNIGYNSNCIGNFVGGAGTLSSLGLATSATLASGEFGMAKTFTSSSAPGASSGKLAVVAGTKPGTCKLIMYAGTSATPKTIVDNVGAGC